MASLAFEAARVLSQWVGTEKRSGKPETKAPCSKPIFIFGLCIAAMNLS
jgi:hypothetical protein